MGDRTYVQLYVPLELKEQAKSIMESADWCWNYEENIDPLYTFHFEEVNYGELPFLDDLAKEGIPYISDWARGDEYREGEQILQFTKEGNAIEKERYEFDDHIPYKSLMKIIEQRGISDTQKINEISEIVWHINRKFTDLPWDNQVEYGKIYKTKRLLKDYNLAS